MKKISVGFCYMNFRYCVKFCNNGVGEYFVIYTYHSLASKAIHLFNLLKITFFLRQALQVFIAVLSASRDVFECPVSDGHQARTQELNNLNI